MCGIVAYVGEKEAAPILMEGIRRLEYRGYDSAGIAIINDGKIVSRKRPGKIRVLETFLKSDPLKGIVGLSHTRWATHGVPNEANAHPHFDCKKRIALVHNGIIENYDILKEQLIAQGHKFRSDTDTEVIVHLIEKYYNGDLEEATRKAVKELKGAYAIAVVCQDEPDVIVGARCGSPLIIGLGEAENYLASDTPALLGFTRDVLYLHENEMVVLKKNSVKITDINGESITRKKTTVQWDPSRAEKEGFQHFMLKEIFEQPKAIKDTLLGRIGKSNVSFKEMNLKEKNLLNAKKIQIISCGTAWHAGLVGRYMLEEFAAIPVEADISSEFRYRNTIIDKNTLVIAVSQSGETADTLAGVKKAKQAGAKILSVCNVLGSTLTHESDAVIYTHAGPEIAVASTKAYTAQLTVFALLTIYLGLLRGTLSKRLAEKFISQLQDMPGYIEKVLKEDSIILNCTRKYYNAKQILTLGRRYNFPTALEAALKLKEISYINAEGYAAGEMKHGPIALVNENMPVFCVATKSQVYDKMGSNIQEVKARRGYVIAIATEGDREIRHHADDVVYIPETEEMLSPILAIVPLQLLAYHIAVKRGCDVDQPRNLAKSVTVE